MTVVNPPQFLHPFFMRTIADNRFVVTNKIELAVDTQDPNSGEIIRSYLTDPLHQVIRCYVTTNKGYQEFRRPDQTLINTTYRILFEPFIPLMSIDSRITLSDGTVHNVVAVDNNDTLQYTHVFTEIIS